MNNNANALAEVAIGFLVCIGIVILIAITIAVLFCLTLQRTLSEVRERNRAMAPGLVWLYLIPLFNIFWSIFIVLKVAESLQNEFRSRGWRTVNEAFGKTVGLFWSVGNIASVFVGCLIGFVDGMAQDPAVSVILNLVNMGISLTILVCWIIYWVQVAQYRRRLREGRRGYAADSVEADYDDDYRRPEDNEYDDQPRRRRRDAEDDFDRGDDDRRRRRDEDS